MTQTERDELREEFQERFVSMQGDGTQWGAGLYINDKVTPFEIEDWFITKMEEREGKNWYYDKGELVIAKGKWVIDRIKSNREEKNPNQVQRWRCGKCEQEEMMSKGITV